jgi:GntR family transcriptional regulator
MAKRSHRPVIDRDSRLPYYDQLKQAIESQLSDGSLKPGDMLPTEPELSELYGVSRTVVRQALGELAASGRIYRIRGKGTFVSGSRLREQFLRPTLGFFDDLTAAGRTVRNHVTKCEVVEVDEKLAKLTGMSAGSRCIELDRIRYIDGLVTASMKSFIPATLHPRLFDQMRRFDLERHSLYRLLEDLIGVRVHSGHRIVRSVAASRALAAELDLPRGAPLLYIESVEQDGHGRQVEFSQAWHRSDRSALEIEVVRPS